MTSMECPEAPVTGDYPETSAAHADNGAQVADETGKTATAVRAAVKWDPYSLSWGPAGQE